VDGDPELIAETDTNAGVVAETGLGLVQDQIALLVNGSCTMTSTQKWGAIGELYSRAGNRSSKMVAVEASFVLQQPWPAILKEWEQDKSFVHLTLMSDQLPGTAGGTALSA
jgi:hypothetical protein